MASDFNLAVGVFDELCSKQPAQGAEVRPGTPDFKSDCNRAPHADLVCAEAPALCKHLCPCVAPLPVPLSCAADRCQGEAPPLSGLYSMFLKEEQDNFLFGAAAGPNLNPGGPQVGTPTLSIPRQCPVQTLCIVLLAALRA